MIFPNVIIRSDILLYTLQIISINVIINNYLITESEVVTGKSQTEALPCRIDRAIARSIR